MSDTKLKIIGAGFGRTGTQSLKLALEQLGFNPCYHMVEVFKHRQHVSLWLAAAHHELDDWNAIFKGYQAMVDFPGSIFYQELMHVYPEAKVLLSVRNPERWYDSTSETIYQLSKVLPQRFLRFVPAMGRFVQMVDTIIWQGLFDGKFENRQYAIATFNTWNDAVKAQVAPENLLVFDVKEGWEPLCTFLDVPVPDTPFPHVNDREAMLRRIRAIKLLTRAVPVLLIVGILLLIYLLTR